MCLDVRAERQSDCLTGHAIMRAAGRLSSFINDQDIAKIQQLAPKYANSGKVYLMVRRFGRCVDTIWEGDFPINGDCLVAVIEGGKVKTVMISKSWRRDYFFRDSKLGLVG